MGQKPTQVYNLLWISPTLAKHPEEHKGKFYQPLPNQTIDNLINITKQNSEADVRLWTDPQKMTPAQIKYLEKVINLGSSENISLANLHTIPEYSKNPFYSKLEEGYSWRHNKHSLIWRQVDAAKILVSLQGDYEQSFFSDLDITNLVINSQDVQDKLTRQGIIISGESSDFGSGYENQLFGFKASKRNFFESIYLETLKVAKEKQKNGWRTLVDCLNSKRFIPEKVHFYPQYIEQGGAKSSEFNPERRLKL